jgi:hypothetical protein
MCPSLGTRMAEVASKTHQRRFVVAVNLWVVPLALLLFAPESFARKPQPEFAPVDLDHLFKDNMTLTRSSSVEREGDASGASFEAGKNRPLHGQVCMGEMCFNNEAKAALSNIVRAYLLPKYGINPVFEQRFLRGVFKSLLSTHWSSTVSGDVIPETPERLSTRSGFVPPHASSKGKRGWLGRGTDAGQKGRGASRAGARYSRRHYLATWALMLSRTFSANTYSPSRPEMLIAAYLSEQWCVRACVRACLRACVCVCLLCVHPKS